ncbi:hypothetical protein J6590_036815 [Homalodisca vitripennis]|nr:hypothetical protein J6590_036815 [Homalodisca vitripennis]
MDVGTDKHSARIRPGNGYVLVPPSRHDYRNVEAQHKGERNQLTGLLAILGYLLKQPVPIEKHCERGRPRDGEVLVPPAHHDQRDVEPQHKRQRDQVDELLTVIGYLFKQPEQNAY